MRDALLESASSEMGTVIQRAISDLPPRDLILLDRRMSKQPWSDVAKELDITEEAARQAWVRAKTRIRDAMRREFVIEELMEDER